MFYLLLRIFFLLTWSVYFFYSLQVNKINEKKSIKKYSSEEIVSQRFFLVLVLPSLMISSYSQHIAA